MGFLNLLHVNHVVLEFARRGYAELGMVDIKDLQVEAADEIALWLEHAERTLGPGRVRYANPDCGMWMLPRNVADGKLRALAQGRDRYLGA